MTLGLQTFTIRKLMRSENEIKTVFRMAASLGIEALEIAVDYLHFPFNTATARMLAQAAEGSGLAIASCQIKYKTAAADLAKTAEWMHILGAKTVVNSVIDLAALRAGQDGILRHCDQLNALADQLGAHNLAFAHHNHHYEFLRVGGQLVLDTLIENFIGGFALDTYWCQKGGGNVIALLERLQGRVPVLHLRDFAVSPFGLLTGGKDAACGEGSIPFEAVLRAAQAAGAGYGMIEQKTKHPLQDFAASACALRNIMIA